MDQRAHARDQAFAVADGLLIDLAPVGRIVPIRRLDALLLNLVGKVFNVEVAKRAVNDAAVHFQSLQKGPPILLLL